MKKELIYYAVLTIVIALLLIFETNVFKNNSKFVSKVIEVESFEKLDIDLECNFYVSLGDEQKVVFEGPEKFLSNLETRLENGVLKIFCKNPGLLADLLNTNTEDQGSVNVYIKLTDSDQLIMPKKGNIISNETLQFTEQNSSDLLSFNTNWRNMLRLISNQLVHIKLR